MKRLLGPLTDSTPSVPDMTLADGGGTGSPGKQVYRWSLGQADPVGPTGSGSCFHMEDITRPAAALVRGPSISPSSRRGGRRVGFNAKMARDWNSFPQIESLQIDLLRLAFNIGLAEKDLAVEAKRCVLLSHVAALEAAGAILESLTSSPALISSLSVDALEALKEAAENIPRQNLD